MAQIRIGLHLHPPPKQSLDAFSDAVRRADRYGFARIGTGDTQWHNMECFVALTLMALNSERVEIGPRVTNPVTREPSVMASAIVSLELISKGRAVLAIGRGDSSVHNIGLRPATVEESATTSLPSVTCCRTGRPYTEDGATVSFGRVLRCGSAFRSASLQRDQECSAWLARWVIKFSSAPA